MNRDEDRQMDNLRRLLRRLERLKGAESIGEHERSPTLPRVYIGPLRGAPVLARTIDRSPARPRASEQKRSRMPILVAMLGIIVLSSATVAMAMSWPTLSGWQHGLLASVAGHAVASKPLIAPSRTEGTHPPHSRDAAGGLLRRAEQLLAGGEIDTARVLLQEAASLGSGTAALKLARSYDPEQVAPGQHADGADPMLAKAWYERALALGTREAARYIPGLASR